MPMPFDRTNSGSIMDGKARPLRRATALALVSGLALSAAPAQAHVLALIAPNASSYVLASVPPTSSCFQYTYDRNGNRLSSSTSTVVNGGAVWGSATYGCATWGS